MTDAGWFEGHDSDAESQLVSAIRTGSADTPDEWPTIAVDQGFAEDTEAYYERLQTASLQAARAAVREHEQADDQQLIHAIRALDDCNRIRNELVERVTEWAGAAFGETGSGSEYVSQIADREPDTAVEERITSLANFVIDLKDEGDALETFLTRETKSVAPNLTALAGPLLAARLIALAGNLESLAKKPAGTVQVLGAEDALFAHLQGQAPSPKHGVIYNHEYVRGTRPDERGSAARALAGKLSIAARIDHYAGDYRPDLERELAERIDHIRSRGRS